MLGKAFFVKVSHYSEPDIVPLEFRGTTSAVKPSRRLRSRGLPIFDRRGCRGRSQIAQDIGHGAGRELQQLIGRGIQLQRATICSASVGPVGQSFRGRDWSQSKSSGTSRSGTLKLPPENRCPAPSRAEAASRTRTPILRSATALQMSTRACCSAGPPSITRLRAFSNDSQSGTYTATPPQGVSAKKGIGAALRVRFPAFGGQT